MSDSPTGLVITIAAGLLTALDAAEKLKARDYRAKPIGKGLSALQKDVLVLLEEYAKQVD